MSDVALNTETDTSRFHPKEKDPWYNAKWSDQQASSFKGETAGMFEHAKQIAQKLGISASTVHVHSKTIRDKLQLGHNEKLVQFATLLRKSRGFQSLMEWDETKSDDDSHDTDLNLVIGGGRR